MPCSSCNRTRSPFSSIMIPWSYCSSNHRPCSGQSASPWASTSSKGMVFCCLYTKAGLICHANVSSSVIDQIDTLLQYYLSQQQLFCSKFLLVCCWIALLSTRYSKILIPAIIIMWGHILARIRGYSVAQHPVCRLSQDPSIRFVVSEPSNTSDQLISIFWNPC